MDSGNSSSLQSSSGGDDDFDSRVDSFSAFFHATSSTVATALLPPQPPPPLSSSSSASDAHHFFDYSSLSYLDSSTPLLPLDSAAGPWPRPFIPSSSNCTAATAPSLGADPAAGSQLTSLVQPPSDRPLAVAGAAAATPSRNTKKRSRASRRAPTTVLTTDTSNFRAMVQEFTGIPSPPFAAASVSPLARSRFDLFHSAAAFRSSSVDAYPPPFLLRPFPQKAQSPPSFAAITNPTSSSPPPLRPLSTINTASANGNTNSTPGDNTNYRLPSHNLGLGGGQSQSLVGLQGPILNFQSLLQPSPYTLPDMAASLNAKPHSANELGGLPPGLIGSEAMRSSWIDGGADLAQLRPAVAVGDYSGSQLRIGSGCKPNNTASVPSEFNGEKASETSIVTRRGDGMVESWIHSSD